MIVVANLCRLADIAINLLQNGLHEITAGRVLGSKPPTQHAPPTMAYRITYHEPTTTQAFFRGLTLPDARGDSSSASQLLPPHMEFVCSQRPLWLPNSSGPFQNRQV